jgi:hypothetical protein
MFSKLKSFFQKKSICLCENTISAGSTDKMMFCRGCESIREMEFCSFKNIQVCCNCHCKNLEKIKRDEFSSPGGAIIHV